MVENHDNFKEEVLKVYDQIVYQKFQQLLPNNANSKVRLVGSCSSYNNCDDIWRFTLKKCEIKSSDGGTIHEISTHCNIVAMNGQNKEEIQRKEASKKNAKKGG